MKSVWADAGVGEPGRTVNPLANAFGGSNPSPPTHRFLNAGVTQLARVTAFQAVGRGFESRLPLNHADVAQLVEHFLGKEEVTGSIPVISSTEGNK